MEPVTGMCSRIHAALFCAFCKSCVLARSIERSSRELAAPNILRFARSTDLHLRTPAMQERIRFSIRFAEAPCCFLPELQTGRQLMTED